MGKSWLPAVFAAGVTVTAVAVVGCTKTTAAPPPGAASKTTEDILKENPEFKKSVVDSRIAQVQQSNLPDAEKQRIIAKLRAEGPPNSQ